MIRLEKLLVRTALRFGATACALIVMGGAWAADTLTVAATGTAMPMLNILIVDFAKLSPDLKVKLLYPPAGSGGAIRGVATGAVDIGVTSRPPKPGVIGADLRAVPWVSTAFVIATNHTNTAKDYTLTDLAAIWSGTTTLWPDGTPIRLLLRSPDDADITNLRAMSPEMSRAVDSALSRPGLPRADHDLHNLEMLEKVPGAIGASTLGLLLSSGSRLTMLPIAGVKPSLHTLQSGAYPYQRTLFLVSNEQTGKNPFIVYLHSARAKVLLNSNGFIKSTP